MKVNEEKFDKRSILQRVGSLSQIAGIYRSILIDGIGKGTNMIRVRNGCGLDFNIIPDKCMDIFDVNFNGIQLAWISKNGLVSNQYFEDNNLRWLRSFGGGMLVTCGLRNVGSPVVDNGEEHGLHGRISGIPARNIAVKEYWKDEIFFQELSAEIRETNVFGENLVIYRTVQVDSESPEIRLTDRIINEGFESQQLMVLYHLNWGFPLFGPKSKLTINPLSTTLRGDDQSEVESWGRFSDPVSGYIERVYFHDLKPDKKGEVNYQLLNSDLGIGVKVSWNKNQLPFFSQWKMQGESEYVLGLEPGNCQPVGRIITREERNAEFLKSFQEKEVQLKIQFIKF